MLKYCGPLSVYVSITACVGGIHHMHHLGGLPALARGLSLTNVLSPGSCCLDMSVVNLATKCFDGSQI